MSALSGSNPGSPSPANDTDAKEALSAAFALNFLATATAAKKAFSQQQFGQQQAMDEGAHHNSEKDFSPSTEGSPGDGPMPPMEDLYDETSESRDLSSDERRDAENEMVSD